MPKPARILLSAFTGSDNLGDEAISLALLGELTPQLKNARLTVISVDPEKTRRLLLDKRPKHPTEMRVRSRFWLPLAILRHEFCIFGGGGIIQDQSSLLNLLYFLIQIQFAKLVRKTVILAFVGIGPVSSRAGWRFMKMALSGIALCIVRDENSRQLLHTAGVTGTNVICASDIALNLKCGSGFAAPAVTREKCLLLSMRHWYVAAHPLTSAARKAVRIEPGSPMDLLLENLARELAVFLDANQEFVVIAVPFFGARDSLVHTELRRRLTGPHRGRFRLHAAIFDPCQYLRLVDAASCVIAMRLHALVLASLKALPLVALSYSPKVRAFMQGLDLADQVIDVACRPDLAGFSSCLDFALQNSGRIRSRVEARIAELQRSNEMALKEIVRIIEGEKCR